MRRQDALMNATTLLPPSPRARTPALPIVVSLSVGGGLRAVVVHLCVGVRVARDGIFSFYLFLFSTGSIVEFTFN